MNNVWVVAPVRDNSVNLSEFVNNLTGGFVIPENYEKETYNFKTQEMETELVPHPHFKKTSPDFSGKIVFINTSAGYATYDGVTNIEDFGDVNIARWMNAGINHAIANGASKVVVLSNPCSFDPSALFDALEEAETKEVVNINDGVMFVIDSASTLRLDDQFKIWFWADDFYRAAGEVVGISRPDFLKISEIIPFIVESEEHIAITKEDEAKYNAKWS